MIKQALLSVSDKTGIVDFARELVHRGVALLSTGGTYRLLKDNGIYILETMNTGPLVAEGVQEFMFVLGQPLIKGTVQAMINPVALY